MTRRAATDPVRDEAERLVAAAIAAVSMAGRGLGGAGRAGSGFATGSPECCVCPVCRVIAAMRDPNADLAERLAGGAGDLAAGVTQLLRAFARGGGAEPEETREGDEFWESLRRRARGGGLASFGQAGSAEDDPWRAATTAEPPPPKPMAKKAVAKKAVAKQVAPAKAAPTKAATAKKVAKKATAGHVPLTCRSPRRRAGRTGPRAGPRGSR